MPEDLGPGVSAPNARCSWCSAELVADAATCPSCGATVASAGDVQVPGVTSIDPQAVLRNVRATSAPRRNRILAWISGEVDEDAWTGEPSGSLAPPPADVRREMLRLELEAHLSNLSAEAGALEAEAEAAAEADPSAAQPNGLPEATADRRALDAGVAAPDAAGDTPDHP